MIPMQQYLDKKGLCPSYDDYLLQKRQFLTEMKRGLSGEKSTLKMIPAYIRADIKIARQKRVIAIDMGGTNMRVALIEASSDGMKILYRKQYPMPGTKGALTKQEFFQKTSEYLAPIANQADLVGLCFSFPCEIQPSLDGKILLFNKEVSVSGAQGAMLGVELNRALAAQGLPSEKKVVVINDTVATLLGAQALTQTDRYESYIGFILGTGTNTCYIERNAEILKNPVLCHQAGNSLINLESGGYGLLPRSDVDRKFDEKTSAPGTQLFEKMVGGVYQSSVALMYMKDAAQAGCFTEMTAASLSALCVLNPQDMDAFCQDPNGNGLLAKAAACDEDRAALYSLVDALYRRAAAAVMCSFSAILEKTGTGRSTENPVCISAEGSTFYKCCSLHERLMALTEEYLGRDGFHVEYVHAEESTLFGSAFAALGSAGH